MYTRKESEGNISKKITAKTPTKKAFTYHKMSTTLDKLLSIRARIVGDLEHHFAVTKTVDINSPVALITFRSIALEKSHREFLAIKEKIAQINALYEVRHLEDIIAKNRVVQNECLEMKKHLSLLMQNQNTACLTAPFSYTPHQSGAKPSYIQRVPNQCLDSGIKPSHHVRANTPQHVKSIETIQKPEIPLTHISNKKLPQTFSVQTVTVPNKYCSDDDDNVDSLSNVFHMRNTVGNSAHERCMCSQSTNNATQAQQLTIEKQWRMNWLDKHDIREC